MRLVIAFPLPEMALGEAAKIQEELRKLNPGNSYRWTTRSVWHLTLEFLGEVGEGKLPIIKEIVESSVSGEKAMPVSFNGLVGFPNLSHPHIVGIGIKDESGQVEVIQSNVKRRLVANKLNHDEKDWKTHLTLLRIKDAQTSLKGTKEIAVTEISFVLDRAVIYQSTLTNNGPVYQELAVYVLDE
jgi:2'-5' RNA ligase